MAPIQDWSTSDGQPDGDIAGPYDEMTRVLAGLPRPRAVRMSTRGKTTVVLIAAVLLASMGIFVAGLTARSVAMGRSAGSSQSLPFALPIIFILVIVPLMLRTITQQKKLITEGEIGVGRVTKRRMARHGPTIHYEFTTPLGEHFSRNASDGSGQLSVGMNVPIFYDPQSPKKQLALCGSFYEVVPPSEGKSF